MSISPTLVARTTLLTTLLLPLAAGGTRSVAAAPQPDERLLSARAPRFLLASATSLATVPIDVRRTPALRERISLDLPDATLAEALEAIARHSGLDLNYSSAVAPLDRPVRLRAENITVAAALTEVLLDTRLDVLFTSRGQATLVRRESERQAPPRPAGGTLTGRIASQGESVAGVAVTVTGASLESARTAISDEGGIYTLPDLQDGVYSVRFELEGLVPVTREVQIAVGQTTTVNITMELEPFEEEIVVTGSRIRRAEVEGPSPVIFLTREDLDRTGRATVAEVLATLPQNFAPPMQLEGTPFVPARVDLRGMGADNTLVLVNGRRVANSGFGINASTTFVDLNSIPLAAVERIEVLTDSASAVYGSDAVAGVVNIILKDDFRGSEISLDYGAASEGGASERQVSFTTGGEWAGFRGLLTGEYLDRRRLSATDRDFSRSNDYRAHGGRDFRSPFSDPGNICSLDGGNLPGLDAPCAGIPTGQDGRNLTPEDFASTAGQINLESSNAFVNLVAPSERWGLTGRVDRDLENRLSLFGEVGVSHTTNDQGFGRPVLANVSVPAGNPFNPFGEDVLLTGWSATEIPTTVRSETDNLRALFGLEGRFGGARGSGREKEWAWESSLTYSRDELHVPGTTNLLPPVVNELLARTDPATALNVFGDGEGANTPAVLDELLQRSSRIVQDGTSDLASWQGHVDGVLARWADRELRLATGAEFRQESLDAANQIVFPQGPSQVLEDVAGDRDVVAGFAEVSLPVFGQEHELPGVRALELQLAGRWESYSDFGETANPKLAVLWKPFASLALRASASTGFRAPALQELFSLGSSQPGVPVLDPLRNNEVAFVIVTFGGNPDLEPEDSESLNVGLVWDVAGIPGLSLTVDGYQVRQDEQIREGTFLLIDFSEELEAAFPSRYRRAEPTPEDIAAGLPGQLLEIDIRSLNLSEAEVLGMDLGLQYLRDTSVGRFDLRLNGAYIDSLDLRLTPVTPVEQVAGTTSSGLAATGSPVRFRGNLSLFWSRGAWELGATERYTGPPREASTASPLFGQRYDDHFETDLRVTYSWPDSVGVLAGTRLSLSVQNLFNAEPPFRDSASGYLGSLHDPRQRYVSLKLTKAFGGASR